MSDITIPPEALEAGAKQICGYERDQEVEWREYIGHATAAITATLRAWPGMKEEIRDGFSFAPLPHGTAIRYPVIILPLPQEKQDAET